MSKATKPKKQHYIPKFLLKNFSEPANPRKEKPVYRVQLYRKGEAAPIKQNINKVFIKHKMHVQDEDYGLEHAFASMESRFAGRLQQVTANGYLDDEDLEDVVQLIANLIIRTLPVREQITNALHELTNQIHEKFNNTTSDEFADATRQLRPRLMKEEIDKKIKEDMPDANRKTRRKTKKKFRRKLKREIKHNMTKGELDQIHSNFKQHVQSTVQEALNSETVPVTSKSAHISALIKLNKDGALEGRLIEILRAMIWELAAFDNTELILPDTGPTIYCQASGNWGFGLSLSADEYDIVALPISPKLALIGRSSGDIAFLSAPELNEGCARSSWKAFVAQNDTEFLRRLADLIGTGKTLIDGVDLNSNEKFVAADFKK